jgi:hypothetical protein
LPLDNPGGLEAEHRNEEILPAHEHLPLHSDAAFERQRAPLGPREGLDLQFQTLTSR